MEGVAIETDGLPRVTALLSGFGGACRADQVTRSAGAKLGNVRTIDAALAGAELTDEADAWLVYCEDPQLAGPLSVLLDTLNGKARSSRVPVIACTSPDLVDLVAARLHDETTTIVCQSTIPDEVAALAVALRPNGVLNRAGEDRTAREPSQLRKLSEDVDRIARVLAALTAEQEYDPGTTAPDGADPAPPLDAAAVPLIRAMVKARRLRARFLPGDLFADPAWDMLLDLMAARVERKRVAVSSLCIAAAVPATTALRYLKTMTGTGLFVRRPDVTDARRVFIELSDTAAEAMARYLAAMRAIIAPVI